MISLSQHCYTRAKRGTLRTNPNYYSTYYVPGTIPIFQNTNSDTTIIPIFTNEETKAEREEVTYLLNGRAM